ncbi:Carbonic anhydrase or acetyltransferase, isoleucine patch superfamily [Lentibacillus halodurans]|uniref:Carbonic anhydrase or acetyltransferase, isoleucine patch superfamily n=1 Tax=Lentibacillus halodurans TaxID=237679 RepID=A0A1I0WT94_9BACI|nr:gamma carbonic anhydrase family protein [Lentibacillus halodurans]SFA91979.1 Carbonic anhydrase or acetyltransferase, isoleucine patch superfamily [Lentibacillus halodurans]
MIQSYKHKQPDIHQSVFIAHDADVIGDVTIGEQSSIWFHTVIRGDVAPTRIGKGVNIQDLSLVHQSPGLPVTIEDYATVGHQVTLHACTVRHNALIGMGSIILDGAEIGENAFIGAGSLVPPGKKIPPHTLAMGRPAKVVRDLIETDYQEMARVYQSYVEKGQYYKELSDHLD